MALKKKISELPIWTDFTGLYTIGVNALGKSVRVSLAYIKEKVDAAIQAANAANNAAKTANTAASNADSSRTKVEQVKQETIKAKDEAILATNNAKTATDNANKAAGTAGTAATAATEKVDKAIADLKEFINRMRPKSMSIRYPATITDGNVRLQRIEATLMPEGVQKNILYIAHNEEVIHVMPDGTIIPKGKGKCKVYVIPTENTSLYKSIEIEIATRGIRMHAPGKIRFLGNSKNMRLN